MWVKTNKSEPGTEQQTGSKLGKVYDKAVYLSLCLFNLYSEYIMWNAGLDKAQAGIKNVGRNQQPQICRWHHSNGRKWRWTKELDEGETGEWKSWLKTQYKKNQEHSIQSHHFMANRRGEKWEQWQILFSWASISLQMVTAVMKLKDTCSLESYDKPRHRIKKQRHHLVNQGKYSQSYGFSSSHVQIWEMDHKEGWALKN